jgi:type VI secretion system protein ImpA
MSIPSAQSLCGPLSADAPCGPDLEYDAAFQALEAAARPRPELEMGDARIEGGGPDWREVKRLALELFDRTRDLRVAVYLAQAAIETDGWHGLAESLGVVYGLVDGMWDTVHPQLDPDDDLDPTMRLNVIVRLCDRESTLNQLREAPIVSARGMGSFSLRDLEVAQGHSSPREGEDAPSLAAVEGAFLAAPVEELESVRGALGEVLDRWASLDGSLTERLGSAQAPNLEPFAETVRRITHALDQQLANRGVGGGAPAGDDGGGDAGGDDAGGGASAGGAPVAARDGQAEQSEVHRAQPRAACADRIRPRAVRRREEGQAAVRDGRDGGSVGQARGAAARVADRKFLEIDVDNFDERLKSDEAAGRVPGAQHAHGRGQPLGRSDLREHGRLLAGAVARRSIR